MKKPNLIGFEIYGSKSELCWKSWKYHEIWNIKELLNLIGFMDIWNCWNMIRTEKINDENYKSIDIY